MGEKMEMIKKQMDFNVQKEIIQWEEQCWILFQQKMRLFRQKVEDEGLELVLEQYWYNDYEKKYIESPERIKFLPGYTYCCRFSIQKDGQMYEDKEGEEYLSCCIYRFVEIKNKLWIPQIWYRHGVFQRKKLYVEMKFEEEFNDKDAQEMVEDYLDEIKRGDYVIP